MRINRLGLFFALALFLVSRIHAQQSSPSPTAVRDPQALTTLQQCLAAAGGTQAISAIQDFTGNGSITYFWAGEQIAGSATVRGLGTSYFRLDANLPQGTNSWFVNGLSGTIKNPDGTTVPILYANAVNRSSLSVPSLTLLSALNDLSVSISTVGTTTVNGVQGVIIQLQKTFAAADDPTGDHAKLNLRKYVIDPQTFSILEAQDTLWSDDGRMLPTNREILFSNFKVVNGINVPLSIIEKLGDQQTWSLQLDTVTFNSGLTADVFKF